LYEIKYAIRKLIENVLAGFDFCKSSSERLFSLFQASKNKAGEYQIAPNTRLKTAQINTAK
jgi:hypothetical protein